MLKYRSFYSEFSFKDFIKNKFNFNFKYFKTSTINNNLFNLVFLNY